MERIRYVEKRGEKHIYQHIDQKRQHNTTKLSSKNLVLANTNILYQITFTSERVKTFRGSFGEKLKHKDTKKNMEYILWITFLQYDKRKGYVINQYPEKRVQESP